MVNSDDVFNGYGDSSAMNSIADGLHVAGAGSGGGGGHHHHQQQHHHRIPSASASLDAAVFYRHWAQQLQRNGGLRLPIPPPLIPLVGNNPDGLDATNSDDHLDDTSVSPSMFLPMFMNPFSMVGRDSSWQNQQQQQSFVGRKHSMKEGCNIDNADTRRYLQNHKTSTAAIIDKNNHLHSQVVNSSLAAALGTEVAANAAAAAAAGFLNIPSSLSPGSVAAMSTLTGAFALAKRNTNGGPQVHQLSTGTINNTKSGAPKQKSEGPPRDKIFVCGVCNRCFGYKHVLQNHERTHTGEKPFECKECHKRFTRDHHLKTHMRLHTGEKPYHCTHCERQFVQVANLRRHLRVHTGERPYACELCTSRFSDSNQLKAHMLIHKGEKPFECKKCMGRFRRRHHLMHHKCPKDEENVGKPRRGRRPKAYETILDSTTMTPTPTPTPTTPSIQDKGPIMGVSSGQAAPSVSAIITAPTETYTSSSLRVKPKRKASQTQRILPSSLIGSSDDTIQTQALDMRVSPSSDMTALALSIINARVGPLTRNFSLLRQAKAEAKTEGENGGGKDDDDDDDEGDEEDVEDVSGDDDGGGGGDDNGGGDDSETEREVQLSRHQAEIKEEPVEVDEKPHILVVQSKMRKKTTT